MLLDPFCGNGTILQEALMMGIKVIGIDKDEKSVKDARQNLKWLKRKYKLKGESKIVLGDSKNLDVGEVDCIVTEPYMGPYLKKYPVLRRLVKLEEI